MSAVPTIDRLLNAAADTPQVVLDALQQHPQLAPQQDAHGYSLVHAAASYGHVDLLQALISQYKVDINIKDEDGETALYNVETVQMAQELLDLGIDQSALNHEGQTAAEKLDDEDEQPQIAAFLRETRQSKADPSATNGAHSQANSAPGTSAQANGDSGDTHGLPALPNGVSINVGTMLADEAGEAPDPEFRRRIEELAARDDFHEATGQQELRDLVSQVVSGMSAEERDAQRRRLG